MLHIHRGVLSESTYRDEDPERAMQPEAVSVVRRRTVPGLTAETQPHGKKGTRKKWHDMRIMGCLGVTQLTTFLPHVLPGADAIPKLIHRWCCRLFPRQYGGMHLGASLPGRLL